MESTTDGNQSDSAGPLFVRLNICRFLHYRYPQRVCFIIYLSTAAVTFSHTSCSFSMFYSCCVQGQSKKYFLYYVKCQVLVRGKLVRCKRHLWSHCCLQKLTWYWRQQGHWNISSILPKYMTSNSCLQRPHGSIFRRS